MVGVKLQKVNEIINAYNKSNIIKQIRFEDIGRIEKSLLLFLILLLIPYFYLKNIYSTILILFLETFIAYCIILRIESILIKKNKLENQASFIKLYRKDWQGIRYLTFVKKIKKLNLSVKDIEQIQEFVLSSLQYEKENSKILFEKKVWGLIISILALIWSRLDIKTEDFPKFITDHKFTVFVIASGVVIFLGAIFVSFRYSIKTKRDKLEEIFLFLEWYKKSLKG